MKLREVSNGLIHLIGLLFAIPFLGILLLHAQDVWQVVSFSIYGSMMILLYLCSVLYHWLPEPTIPVFRRFDHIMIYAFIAGTYTPFCLVTLNGAWGWSLFGVIWGIAVVAISIQAVFIDLPRSITTLIYMLMGWICIIALLPLYKLLPTFGFYLLVLGGLIYSVGGVIYAIKRPNIPHIIGYHQIWHILVLFGSVAHAICVLFFVQ